MEPQSSVSKCADDSIPFGLRIVIKPIPEGPSGGIGFMSGADFSPSQKELPLVRHLGRIMVTPAAAAALRTCDISLALRYHLCGESDRGRRDDSSLPSRHALKGCRVLAAYRSSQGQTFWIITEADRSRTTVLMPKDYGATTSDTGIR
jgi:hypothetical protein